MAFSALSASTSSGRTSATNYLGPEWNLIKNNQMLVGRDAEAKKIQEILTASVNDHVQLTILLHGPAGVGKSSLVSTLPCWDGDGFVMAASGKYEQSRQNEPFSALIVACQQLVEVWVARSTSETMNEFRRLMNEDYQVMHSILPHAYYYTTTKMAGAAGADDPSAAPGDHVVSAESSPNISTANHQRSSFSILQSMATTECVNAAFVRLLKFLSKDGSILLWLDDLQWADKASLDVLNVLMSGRAGTVESMLLLLSYRDDEVSGDHAMMQLLTHVLQPDGTPDAPPAVRFYDIPLEDLPVTGVNQMVAAIVERDPEDTLPLAQVIHTKTAGNPFFVIQFLLMLRREQFIRYSCSTFKWEWGDIEKLWHAAKLSDNVADLIASCLDSLPDDTRIAIQVASCLGKVVPEDILVEFFASDYNSDEETCKEGGCQGLPYSSRLHNIQEGDLRRILDRAVKSGILIKPHGQDSYLWAHDKLQHVAYSLIPKESQGLLHMRLGKLLWRLSLASNGKEWMVYMAADQLNRFSGYHHDKILGAEVATLCLEAAKLSLSKSALVPAYDMLEAGLRHLPIADRWTTHYTLGVEIVSTFSELALQLGKNDEAIQAANEVKSHAKSLDDKFPVECVILGAISSGKDRNYAVAVQKTLDLLTDYGIKFPSKLIPGQLFVENQKWRRKLSGGKLSTLLQLPEMTNQRSRHIIRLLVQYFGIFTFMAQGDKDMSWYAFMRSLTLSAEQGVCEDSALGIVGWAAYLCESGSYIEADEYAELGLKLLERFPAKIGSLHAQVLMLATSRVFTRTRPWNVVLDWWLEVHHAGLRTGNTEKAAVSVLGYTYAYLMVGLPIGSLKADLLAYEREAQQFCSPETVKVMFQLFHQFVLNLEQDVALPAVLKGVAMDEDQVLNRLHGNGLRMTRRDLFSLRLFLAMIFGYWDMADLLVDELEPFLNTDGFLVRADMLRATMALVCSKLFRMKGKRKHRIIAKKIMKELEKDLKIGNVNVHPLYMMLLAEQCPCKEKYDEAIRVCARLGLIHFEAYICERAGEYFVAQNDSDGWTGFYIAQAIAAYDDWGAHGKANRMHKEYAERLKSADSRAEKPRSSSSKGQPRYSPQHADILKDFHWERQHTYYSSCCSVELKSNSGSASTGSEDSSTELWSESSKVSNSAANPFLLE